VAKRSQDESANGGEGAGRERWANSEVAQQRLEQWGSRVGRAIAVAAARVREEAEDIWAEAQSIRRGERD
jgi:hypothetical protein